MKLSIIVPVYNMAADDKLKHCMDSLLAQTIEDYEIVAVDDASTDDSLKILRAYENKFPSKVKVLEGKVNHRQGGAKNLGLQHAVGDWIGFIDSDDWIASDMYEKLLKRAEETGADLVGCDYTIVDHFTMEPQQIVINNTSEQVGVLNADKHKKHILRAGSMVVKIYKHSVIKENDLCFPSDIFYEDNCAAPLWSMYFTHFERVEEPLYFYYTVPTSTTHHVSWKKCEDRMKAEEIFLQECKKRNLLSLYEDEIEFRFTELFYTTTLFSYMYGGKNRKCKHTALLRKKIREYYPEFEKNPYYPKMMQPEEQKLIRMHQKSNLLFFVYYVLLFGYRNVRKKIEGKK